MWRDADLRISMKDQMVSFAIGYLREAQACEIKLATCLAIVALSFEWENSFDLSKGDQH